jgi:hypothetical protein
MAARQRWSWWHFNGEKNAANSCPFGAIRCGCCSKLRQLAVYEKVLNLRIWHHKFDRVSLNSFFPSSEIQEGIQLINEKNDKLDQSPKAAKIAISQVVISRIFMATPGVTFSNYFLFKYQHLPVSIDQVWSSRR